MFRKLNPWIMIATVLFASVGFSVAQTDQDEEYPPNAKPGECWAKCRVHPTYETFTEKVLVKEASTRLEMVPARYETVTEQVMVKPASTRLEVVPAKYKDGTEQIQVKEASKKLERVSAVYENVTERIEVTPATTKWEKGKATAGCLSADPEDCRVWCLVEVPATYKTITKRVLKTPETTRDVKIPAEYKTIAKQVLVSPATTREIAIPAEYKTVTRTVLAEPAGTREIAVPAEYRTVTRQRLANAGSVGEWRPVICDSQLTSGKIRQIQIALRDAGYDPGPIDNLFGRQTKAALARYQRDNKLPEGNLDFETLKSLGVQP